MSETNFLKREVYNFLQKQDLFYLIDRPHSLRRQANGSGLNYRNNNLLRVYLTEKSVSQIKPIESNDWMAVNNELKKISKET
jgi:hypothetical protein